MTPSPTDATAVDDKTVADIASALHNDWCGCDSWDGRNCETFHDEEFPEAAEAVKPVVAAVLNARQQFDGYVVAGYDEGAFLKADWDGDVHPNLTKGLNALNGCRNAGYADYSLYGLTKVEVGK